MEENVLKMLKRIKNSDDGKDFINYLVRLSSENYKVWKLEGGDILRGRALALDWLIDQFESCDNTTPTVTPEWI